MRGPIHVTKFGATLTDDKNKFKTAFDKASLKLAIDFMLDSWVFLSLDSLWILTQQDLWLFYIYITMRKNSY